MEVALQQLVWQRAEHRCEYCQYPADVSLLPFQIDHIALITYRVIALVPQKRDSLPTRQRTVLQEPSMTTEYASQFVADPLPFAKLLGLELVTVTPERVEAVLHVREDLCTRPAVLHGGAVMALADTLGAIATVANLAEGTTTTTIESKTNFFAAIPVGETARAECTPLHRGRTTMVWQTRVTRGDGRVAALVIQTQLVLPATR
jgi:uncharacterized protein (TIGR00369 family)